MIEWKKYIPDDKESLPTLNVDYIVANDNEAIAIAEFCQWTHDDSYAWLEVREGISLEGITHYAEINLPLKEANDGTK